MRIAILGAGAWGTALAAALAPRHDILLWTRNPEDRARLREQRTSARLPGITLPESVFVAEAADAMAGADLFIAATSTAGLDAAVRAFSPAIAEGALLWACKGFESATGRLPHEVVGAILPADTRRGALSGPSFALEVARGLPTALVLASTDAAFAAQATTQLNSPRLRIYSSTDVIGVELGGAVKNVIAIAAGLADGLQLGTNARAALITRGLSEIVRLGEALGGRPETFAGLAGLGDLVLTCTGTLSRNHEVGVQVGRGLALGEVLAQLGHVAEGVESAREVRARARHLRIDMPIVEAVCGVLFEGVPARDAVRQLLAREPRAESPQ
ncbi:MAG TPA: NAD(P)H-dependent glycerol-3-phosphate dehydrogenase [Usitatibacter sp.]|nr:NAD(P)H-dependent glycerol-3-phosphate dehydrogenase [Usitatibacter sp.]